MEKLTIVKVGGKIVEDDAALENLLTNFPKIEGYKILVHGGGRSATLLADRLGIESKMIDGRRITDKETLDVVTMVYGGLINKKIVAKLQALQVDAIGLSGADMNIIRSDKRAVGQIDYGFVGDITAVAADKLYTLLKHDITPILAPLTHDGKGNILNTNADTIANEVAIALSSSFWVDLIYCFEKSGVLLNQEDNNSLIANLSKNDYEKYKTSGVISGGMLPKLDNAFRAIASGVKHVIITHATQIANPQKGTTIS